MTQVFSGIDHPKDEPERNKHRDPERRSKFDAKAAKSAVEGDYYLSTRAPGGFRYVVDVDGESAVVTHQLCRKNSFSDDLEWKDYDAVENLVIKIDGRQTHGDLRYAALRSIESSVYATPLGRAIGRDAMRPIVEAFAASVGCDVWKEYTESDQAFTVDIEKQGQARDALKALLEWAPESGYHPSIGKLGAEVDGVGYARDADEYVALLEGITDGFGTATGGDNPLPLLSEPVYYAIAGGKDGGRSLKSRIQDLKNAVGWDDED